MNSYYGRPVLKEPTWTWEIPTYFFTGGLSGASSVLSMSAKLFGNEKLSRTALFIGAPEISSRRRSSSPTSAGPSASTTCCACSR